VTSARVGREDSIMLSSISVAVIVNLPARSADWISDFWISGSCSSSASTPRSPRATMIPSDCSSRPSMFSSAARRSIFEIISAPGTRARTVATSSGRETKLIPIMSIPARRASSRSLRSAAVGSS
jgi:hypothetical protein